MVVDQKQTPIIYVVKRQVIDGQQRLTTLQIFLAVFRDFCMKHGCKDVADELQTYIFNKGMMADAAVERFKVWPTQADRAQFMDVMSSGSREELIKRYPLVRKKFARLPDPRPRMVSFATSSSFVLQGPRVAHPWSCSTTSIGKSSMMTSGAKR